MNSKRWQANILLLLTAVIWGFAFVAQRAGMAHIGPFTFNGIRFALGAVSLLPLRWLERRRAAPAPIGRKNGLAIGAVGLVLFIAASLQQIGVSYTTAGKAGFITGLYVIFVPLMGLLWGQQARKSIWLGAALAVVGLYLLSVTPDWRIEWGDLIVLAGALFWAGHVQLIGRFSAAIGPIRLSFWQFVICSALSLLAAGLTETPSWTAIAQTAAPILYGGLMSVGVAYTLQVVAQREAHPAHAAIILSLESAFAAMGGWLILSEQLPGRGLWGCALMLGGMLLAQIAPSQPQPQSQPQPVTVPFKQEQGW